MGRNKLNKTEKIVEYTEKITSTILFPTDFSENSENAFKYALHVADHMRAKIIFLSVYNSPVVDVSMGATIIPEVLKEKEQFILQKINALKQRTAMFAFENNCEIRTDHIISMGFVADETIHAANELKPDLIIVSAKGKRNATLFSSHTSAILSRSEFPVLVIPENAAYKTIKKTAYATELHEDDSPTIRKLLKFVDTFNSSLSIFHFGEADKKEEVELLNHYKQYFVKELKYTSLTFEYLPKTKLLKDIDDYLAKNAIDLLVMAHHKHLFPKIFGKDMTKVMAFHSDVPLLVYYN